jgi:tetratricopeptide (TPR) repeat protein
MPDARTLYKTAFSHFVKGEDDRAIELYREALDLDAGLAIAWNGLSLALARRGDLEAAIEAGRHLVTLEPEDPLSHTNLSRLLQQKGLIPEAEEERAVAMRLQMAQQQQG